MPSLAKSHLELYKIQAYKFHAVKKQFLVNLLVQKVIEAETTFSHWICKHEKLYCYLQVLSQEHMSISIDVVHVGGWPRLHVLPSQDKDFLWFSYKILYNMM
jgi:hypothetical protein